MILDRPLNLSFEAEGEKNATVYSTESVESTSALIQQLEELKSELHVRNEQLEAKNHAIDKLTLKNRELVAELKEKQEQQRLMNDELRKAETQIELITELIDNNDLRESE